VSKKKVLAIYLAVIPVMGAFGGLLTYGAYRLLGYPDSGLIFSLIMVAWIGVCLISGIYESALTLVSNNRSRISGEKSRVDNKDAE